MLQSRLTLAPIVLHNAKFLSWGVAAIVGSVTPSGYGRSRLRFRWKVRRMETADQAMTERVERLERENAVLRHALAMVRDVAGEALKPLPQEQRATDAERLGPTGSPR